MAENMGLGWVFTQMGNYFTKAIILTVKNKGRGSAITKMRGFSIRETLRMGEKMAHGKDSIQTVVCGLIAQGYSKKGLRSAINTC